MKNIKLLSKISFFIFAVLVVQFIYFGITTSIHGVFEGDSVIFHIPIAQQLAKFTFIPADLTLGLGYLPATAEAILSLFLLLHIPINLFNVLALVCLFIAAKKVAEAFGISKDLSIIYGVAIATLQSVLRWPLTQVSDIWLAVFFLAVLYLLKTPETTKKYFARLGFFTGMLIGAKPSGIAFAGILLFFFGLNVFRNAKVLNVISFAIPVIIFGLSWYIRNFVLTGNPFYPVGIFSIAGNPEYSNLAAGNWSIFANVTKNPAYVVKVFNAFLSEFFIWTPALILPIYSLIKKKNSLDLRNLSFTAIIIFLVFVFTFPAESIVSNMRHIYTLMDVLILQAFLIFDKKPFEIASFSLLAGIFPIMNFDYHPKILIIAFIPAFYFIFLKGNFFDKVKRI